MESKDKPITVAQAQVLRGLGQTHDELVAEGWRWSEEDQDYAKPGNLEWDNGCGYGNIADDLEEKYGKVDFGYAGGCVNMVIDTESGHRINVTDANQPFLTYLPDHNPGIGYSVGVYPLAEWGWGPAPIVQIEGYVGVDRLPRLIEVALRAVQKGTCGAYYSQWGRSCGLPRGHSEERHRECEISWDDAMALEPRRACGAAHPGTKLSDEQIAEIRRRCTGVRGEQAALAREFGVSKSLVNQIVLGKAHGKGSARNTGRNQ